MANTKKISSPADLWPLQWDKEEKDTIPQITEEERQELQDLMAAENAILPQQKSSEE